MRKNLPLIARLTLIFVFSISGFSTASHAKTYLFHNDHLGTPQALTDVNQQVVWQSEQRPFGDISTSVNQIEQNLRFPGQYFDSEANLHYNYFRSYDSSIGRYTQSDPIGLMGGLLSYGYTDNNTLSGIDPYGLVTCVIVSRGKILPGYDGHKKGSHARMWVSSGGSAGGAWAYDPAGSFGGAARPRNDVFDESWSNDTGGTYGFGDFSSFGSDLGQSIEVECKDTTSEQEKNLYKSAMSQGTGGPLYCAHDVSDVLFGNPLFDKVREPRRFIPKYPVTLIEEVRQSSKN